MVNAYLGAIGTEVNAAVAMPSLQQTSMADRRQRVRPVQMASDMPIVHRRQGRGLPLTLGKRLLATGMEVTTGWRVERARHLAGEHDLLAALIGSRWQGRREQGPGVGVLGRPHQRLGLAV